MELNLNILQLFFLVYLELCRSDHFILNLFNENLFFIILPSKGRMFYCLQTCFFFSMNNCIVVMGVVMALLIPAESVTLRVVVTLFYDMTLSTEQ